MFSYRYLPQKMQMEQKEFQNWNRIKNKKDSRVLFNFLSRINSILLNNN